MSIRMELMLSILQKLEMNLLALENQGLECLEIQVKLLLFFLCVCVCHADVNIVCVQFRDIWETGVLVCVGTGHGHTSQNFIATALYKYVIRNEQDPVVRLWMAVHTHKG